MADNFDINMNTDEVPGMYYQLGDALRYTMLQEFKSADDKKSLNNYRSAISYMYLNGLITLDSVIFFQKLYISIKADNYSQDELCEMFALNLMNDPSFWMHIPQNLSFEKILDYLNIYKLDSWHVLKYKEIFDLIPAVCLISNKLYYFTHKSDGAKLYSLYVSDIFHEVDFEDIADFISDKYEGFIDYDMKTRGNKLLLRYKNTNKFYCCYDGNRNIEECCTGMLLGFIKGKPVVRHSIDGKEFLYYKDGKDKKILMECDEEMIYTVKDDYVLARSSFLSSEYKKPYRCYVDGSIDNCSYKEELEPLWERLCAMTVGPIDSWQLTIRRTEFLNREKFRRMPSKLNLKFLKDTFLLIDIESKEYLYRFKHVIKVLEAFFKDEDDMLDVISIMMDVSVQSAKPFTINRFPSEELYEELIDLFASGRLEEVMPDTNKLKNELEKLLIYFPDDYSDSFKPVPVLGTFEFRDKEFRYERIEWPDCHMVGSMIAPKNKRYDNVIMYDIMSGRYNICFSGNVEEDLQEIIEEVFSIYMNKMVWVTNEA